MNLLSHLTGSLVTVLRELDERAAGGSIQNAREEADASRRLCRAYEGLRSDPDEGPGGQVALMGATAKPTEKRRHQTTTLLKRSTSASAGIR